MQAVGVSQLDVAMKHPEVGPGAGVTEWPLKFDQQRQAGHSDINAAAGLGFVVGFGISHAERLLFLRAGSLKNNFTISALSGELESFVSLLPTACGNKLWI